MTPHGTPASYLSCRTDSSCPNHRTALMTCREAAIRYRGDYQYMRLVDAGTPPLGRDVFVKPPRVPKAPKLRRERKPKGPTRPRATNGVIGPDGLVHGTGTGYRRCKDPDGCPAVAAGLLSCVEIGRAVAAESWRRRHPPKPQRVARHGTASGYVQFKCRTGCPNAAVAGGVSCSEATSDAARARYQARKVRAK